MKRWGLRFIFCWLSVFITAACGQFNSPTPTSDNSERTPTLQDFIPPSTASPSQPFRPLYTLTPPHGSSASRLATVEAVRGMMIEDPSCYETPVESLICLGWIQNTQEIAISDVVINFYLLNPQGSPLNSLQINPSLEIIPPNSGSPYRALFDAIPSEDWQPYVELIDFHESSIKTAALYPEVDFETFWTGRAYDIRGVVRARQLDVEMVNLVTVIRGQQGNITGFRTLKIELDNEGVGEFLVTTAPLDGNPGTVFIKIAPIYPQ